jgi:lysophospholipase L1-like esterase
MKFRTEIDLSASVLRLRYAHRLLAMGSCFADRIGERLALSKFQVKVNPLGISYNPLSLARLLHLSMTGERPEAHYAPHLEAWHSFDLHSRFNQLTREEFERQVAEAFDETAAWLAQTRYLLITLGTAWVYRHRETGQIVNNNHRYADSTFVRESLSVDEVVGAWRELIPRLRAHSPGLQLILTVSPVRHTRDTLPGNSLSKATLRLACHQLCEQHSGVHYFPAFEIMIDDLRDYRFYGEDLIHPSAVAEQYIWEKFTAYCLDEANQALLRRVEQIQRDLNHRPRQPKGKTYRQFLLQLQRKLDAFDPQVDFSTERQQIDMLLKALAD